MDIWLIAHATGIVLLLGTLGWLALRIGSAMVRPDGSSNGWIRPNAR